MARYWKICPNCLEIMVARGEKPKVQCNCGEIHAFPAAEHSPEGQESRRLIVFADGSLDAGGSWIATGVGLPPLIPFVWPIGLWKLARAWWMSRKARRIRKELGLWNYEYKQPVKHSGIVTPQ